MGIRRGVPPVITGTEVITWLTAFSGGRRCVGPWFTDAKLLILSRRIKNWTWFWITTGESNLGINMPNLWNSILGNRNYGPWDINLSRTGLQRTEWVISYWRCCTFIRCMTNCYLISALRILPEKFISLKCSPQLGRCWNPASNVSILK